MTSSYYKELEIKILHKLFPTAEPTSQFDPADMILYFKDRTIIGEIKYRHQPLNSYRNEKFMEVDKYNSLITKALDFTNPTIIYINVFEDGYYSIWNINRLDMNRKIYKRKMNKTTATDFNNSGIQVYKDVYYLSIDEATITNKIIF